MKFTGRGMSLSDRKYKVLKLPVGRTESGSE